MAKTGKTALNSLLTASIPRNGRNQNPFYAYGIHLPWLHGSRVRGGRRLYSDHLSELASAGTADLNWLMIGVRRIASASPKVWAIVALLIVALIALSKISPESQTMDEQANLMAQQQKQDAANAEKKRESEAASFSSMTAAEHIERARIATAPGTDLAVVEEGLRNLKAISPSGTEAGSVKVLQRKLAATKDHLRNAQQKAERTADVNTEKANRALRDARAKEMENNMLRQGANVEIAAVGENHATLRITWLLVNKALAFQLSENGELLENARSSGFKRVEITDGYYMTWSWHLK